MKRYALIAAAVLLALALAFAGGRWLAPTKTVVKTVDVVQWETKINTVTVHDRVEHQIAVAGPVHRVIVTRTIPDPTCKGQTDTTTTTTEDQGATTTQTNEQDHTQVASQSSTTGQETRETTKTVTRDGSRLFLALQATVPAGNPGKLLKPDYTATAALRFLGPLHLVLSAGTDRRVSVGLGVSW